MKSKIQKTNVFLLRSSSSCMSSFLNYLEYIRLPSKRPSGLSTCLTTKEPSESCTLFLQNVLTFTSTSQLIFSHTWTELVPLDLGENRVPLSRIQSPFPYCTNITQFTTN